MSPTLMHTAPKTEALINSLGHFARHGFALMVPRGLSEDERASLAGEMAPLAAAVGARVRSIAAAEKCCGDLVDAKKLECFPLMTDDQGPEWVRKHAPAHALVLFGATVPSLSVPAYLAHLIPRLHCSEEVLVMAMVYIARVVKAGIPFTARSAHRIVLGALLLAIKTHDEPQYPMYYYAKIGGISALKLAKVEASLLNVLGFATQVHPVEYTAMLFSIRSCHAQLKGASFGAWSEVVESVGTVVAEEPGSPSLSSPSFSSIPMSRLSIRDLRKATPSSASLLSARSDMTSARSECDGGMTPSVAGSLLTSPRDIELC